MSLLNPNTIYDADAKIFFDRYEELGCSFTIEFKNAFSDLVSNLKLNALSPYKAAVILISQSGTNAPTFISLENTIGTLTTDRVSSGVYRINSTNQFTENKTCMLKGYSVDGGEDGILRAYRENNNAIKIEVPDGDGFLSNVLIEIRIYNT